MTEAPRAGRGRPRKSDRMIGTKVFLSPSVYDLYARAAGAGSLSELCRAVLTANVPQRKPR